MSKKKRKSYSREFKMEAVGLISEKGYSIAEACFIILKSFTTEKDVIRRFIM